MYQIYPKSFANAKGDGYGDLKGENAEPLVVVVHFGPAHAERMCTYVHTTELLAACEARQQGKRGKETHVAAAATTA